MDSNQLRLCFFDVLGNRGSDGVNQFGDHLMKMIAHHAVRRGFMPAQQREPQQLTTADQEKVRVLFWSFIIQGMIVPGYNVANTNLPFFSLTEYGYQVINSKDPVPHDPDNYLKDLKEKAPNLDPIAISYVEEGLECFQRGTYRAAIVMLGVSCEKLTFALAEAVRQALPSAEADKLLKVIQRGRIGEIYDETMKRVSPRFDQLPRELTDGIEAHLDGVFAIIRTHRNKAGHPTAEMIDRNTALGLFSSFPFYCKRASELISYIQRNGLP